MNSCLKGDLVELWLQGSELHVKLSSAFLQEIVVRQQAIADWERQRAELQDEVLPDVVVYEAYDCKESLGNRGTSALTPIAQTVVDR